MSNNDKKRICFFVSSFRGGGGEKVMIELANGFSRRGYSVDLVAIKSVGDLKETISSDVNVHSVDGGRIIFSVPRYIKYLYSNKPDVVVTLDDFTHIIGVLGKIFYFGKLKLCLRFGNMMSILYGKYDKSKKLNQKAIPFLAKRLYKKADVFIANSKGVAADLKKVYEVGDDKIVVISNPKNIDKILKLSNEEVDWKYDNKVIAAMGRLREQKDFPTLLKAFKLVSEDHDVNLIILGVGREEKRLKALAEELDILDRVEFLGFKENPYPYIKKSDMFVMTSLWEGLPNALLESMILGMPVISADCKSGPRELISPDTDVDEHVVDNIEYGDNGVLVPVGSVDLFAQAIKKVIGDEELRKNFGDNAKEHTVKYDTENILDQYVSIFN